MEQQGISEYERSNVLRGLELAKQIAREHEEELSALIDSGKVQTIADQINEGSITSQSLVDEFEERASKEGINLDDFYTEAPRTSLHANKIEALGMAQIMLARQRNTEDK